MGKFLRGFVHAGRGIAAGIKGELNLKVMLVMAAATTALGFYRGVSRLEWVALVLAMGLVLALELFNTAVERLADLVQPEFDPRCGLVKDLAAGSVLIASAAALAVGVLVFMA